MATGPDLAIDASDAPNQRRHPLTALIGGGAGSDVLSTLVQTEGRYALTRQELLDRVGAVTPDDIEAVEGMLSRLGAVGVVDQPSLGVYLFKPDGAVSRRFRDLDLLMLGKQYPDAFVGELRARIE
jgi:hypothetical protein